MFICRIFAFSFIVSKYCFQIYCGQLLSCPFPSVWVYSSFVIQLHLFVPVPSWLTFSAAKPGGVARGRDKESPAKINVLPRCLPPLGATSWASHSRGGDIDFINPATHQIIKQENNDKSRKRVIGPELRSYQDIL